jgi:hypothetical protein
MVDLTVGRERRVPSAGLTEVMGGKEEEVLYETSGTIY